MTWAVAFWEAGRVVTRASDHFAWGDLPTEGVLWVDVREGEYHHRLVGADNYWVHDRAFGVFNDPENWRWYGGTPSDQYRAWRWTGAGSERVRPAAPPAFARVLRGVLVPDEVAWDLGLLQRGEHLPVRPS